MDEHGDVLFRYVLLRLRDGAVAEEVVQETFVAPAVRPGLRRGVCLFVPGTLLTAPGAAIFGAYWGFAYVWLGAMADAYNRTRLTPLVKKLLCGWLRWRRWPPGDSPRGRGRLFAHFQKEGAR